MNFKFFLEPAFRNITKSTTHMQSVLKESPDGQILIMFNCFRFQKHDICCYDFKQQDTKPSRNEK